MKLKVYEQKKAEAIEKMVQAVKTGTDEDVKAAVGTFYEAIHEKIKADYEAYQQTSDEQTLLQRGYRQLTSEEKKFYQAIMDSVKASDYKQTLLSSIPDGAMPTTIIADVYKELKEEHPLLSKISFKYVGYITKWILSDHSSQKASWGKITDKIIKEITSGLKEIDVHQNKLSAFVLIPQDLIKMGPTFLDGYVREILKEALALGMEDAIINGNGVNCPIGMNRDIHEGVEHSDVTGYPEKAAIAVKSFSPKDYGALIANLAKTEKGKNRTFGEVMLVCNMTDYLTKIMPATTVNNNGTYVKDVFPFATDVVRSSVVEEGKAIIGLPQEYYLLAGGSEEGTIETADEYKFIEDERAYKIKQYAEGRAYDNNCFIVIDITELEEMYITVMSKSVQQAAAEPEIKNGEEDIPTA